VNLALAMRSRLHPRMGEGHELDPPYALSGELAAYRSATARTRNESCDLPAPGARDRAGGGDVRDGARRGVRRRDRAARRGARPHRPRHGRLEAAGPPARCSAARRGGSTGASRIPPAPATPRRSSSGRSATSATSFVVESRSSSAGSTHDRSARSDSRSNGTNRQRAARSDMSQSKTRSSGTLTPARAIAAGNAASHATEGRCPSSGGPTRLAVTAFS
jgi:hypothetical protein